MSGQFRLELNETSMKYLFVILFVLLLIASGVTALMMPEQQTGKPILYWVTDANPARFKQIELFEHWMVKNGHTAPDGTSAVELRLDTANADPTKMTIQTVSGVAGDIMDVRGGGDMRFFRSMGVLADLTDSAKAMGFDPGMTYAAAAGEITVDGRQYAFPCNVSTHGYWINKDVFAKAGVESPPYRWTIEEFESIGKELCEKANAGLSRRQVFFCSQVEFQTFARSLGLDRYNETMTRCILDDERFADVLGKVYQWTYVDNIMPTPEDSDAFAAQQSGYGGGWFQLFNRGNFAMLYSGRFALIQVRKFDEMRKTRGDTPLNLAVVEPPHGGFPNTNILARSASVYMGSPQPEYAKLFLKFLVSEEYNMQIIRDGDSLPPIPKYTQTEAFRHPPDFPSEWEIHEPFARMAEEIAIENSYSPFIADRTFVRIQNEVLALLMAHRLNARAAAATLADKVNAEIQRSVLENPALKEKYEQMVERQTQIESLRAEGKPVPIELISNPFYRAYYAHNGWLTAGNRPHGMESPE